MTIILCTKRDDFAILAADRLLGRAGGRPDFQPKVFILPRSGPYPRNHEQAADLQALLAGLDRLPAGVEAKALRTLHRVDTELTGLVQRIGEAGLG
jgi:hypothetical protein